MAGDGEPRSVTDQHPVSLQARLEVLFERTPNPETGKRYTAAQVEAAVRKQVERLRPEERQGRGISATYVWQLLTGKRSNPTLRHLQSLAEVFGVPVTYFVDDDATSGSLQETAELARLAHAAGVQDIMYRAVGTDDNTLRLVRDLLKYAQDRRGPDRDDQP
jgi:transcriptional regulator with XRE-family HTH domain